MQTLDSAENSAGELVLLLEVALLPLERNPPVESSTQLL